MCSIRGWVEDILDRDLVDQWREDDVEQAAERRRLSTAKAKLTRSQKAKEPLTPKADEGSDERFKLQGWSEFERESGL